MRRSKRSRSADDGPSEATPRIVVRVELTPHAKQELERVAEKAGFTQVAVSSRLMEWFAQQTPTFQALILSQIPAEIEPEVARMALEQYAKGKPRGKGGRRTRKA